MVSAFYDEAWAHRDVDAWPFLLAGPIVRRVARGSAAVFVATREACSVTLTLHEGTSASSRAVGSATAPTVPLGLRLHVCVVEATGLTLTPGQLYGYDLSFAATSGTFTLADLGELQGSVPLGYLQGDLPAFLLPGSADDLRIVHSSCRKMHGGVEGQGIEPDMLHVLDRLIQDAGTDPRARPQQLFLTGDQIYADDVPAAVLDATTRLGRLLLGWSIPETFPDRDGVTTYPDDHVGLDPGDRSVFLDAQGVKDRPPGVEGLCDYAASHLLFFGEWCAMYLLAWSPALWQMRVLVDPDDAEAHPSRSWFVLNETKDVLSDVDKPPDTTTAALVYAQTLPFVRRALANVATYMIFDDHDVTDDWFLNGKVDAQLRGRGEDPGPGGRRLMRNALAAYAVFQHWGNAPEQFAPGTPGVDPAHPDPPPVGHRRDAADRPARVVSSRRHRAGRRGAAARHRPGRGTDALGLRTGLRQPSRDRAGLAHLAHLPRGTAAPGPRRPAAGRGRPGRDHRRVGYRHTGRAGQPVEPGRGGPPGRRRGRGGRATAGLRRGARRRRAADGHPGPGRRRGHGHRRQ